MRVGLAGYGLAGRVFHAPLIRAVDGLELSAVLTSRDVGADVPVVTSFDALLDASELVVVATPNVAHVPMALAARERGLPVVVDKPLAVSVSDARRIAVEGVTVFHNRRWDLDFQALRAAADGGALGELVRFESRFERFRPEVKAGAWRESPDPADGGGLLLDLGSHLVDQARVLLGPVARVYAELRRVRPGARVDDDVFLALEHRGGAISHLWASAAAPTTTPPTPRFRLTGLRDGFASDGLDPQEDELDRGDAPREEGYLGFYRAVLAWAHDGGPVPVDPADAVAGLQILEAARASAASHDVIEIKEQQ